MSNIVLNPEQRQALKKAVDEAVNSKYRIDGENDLIKAIRERVKDELELPTKTFNALVTRAYKMDAKKFNDDAVELLDLCEEIGVYSHADNDNE